MTEQQKQELVDAALSALLENALPVRGLTPVKSAGADDWIELDGGRRISARDLVQGMDGLAEVWRTFYKLHGRVTLTAGPGMIEKGVANAITLKWSLSFGDEAAEAESLTLTENGVVIGVGDASLRSLTRDGVDGTRDYALEAVLPYGVAKRATARVAAYYPVYVGSSGKEAEALTPADILSFAKQGIRANPSGTYTMTVANDTEYIYICVPEGMAVTKALMGGMPMVLRPAVTVAVDGKGGYLVYRSEWSQDAGRKTFTLEGTGTAPAPDPAPPVRHYLLTVEAALEENGRGDALVKMTLAGDGEDAPAPDDRVMARLFLRQTDGKGGRYRTVAVGTSQYGKEVTFLFGALTSAADFRVSRVAMLTKDTGTAMYRAAIAGAVDYGTEVYYEASLYDGETPGIELLGTCDKAVTFVVYGTLATGGTVEAGRIRIAAGETAGQLPGVAGEMTKIWVERAFADGDDGVRFVPFYEYSEE